ncbi:uncharacterized protein A1O9_09175 [Exophiala aquamarina CBS 119918]|uniref:3-beta hydroxysteroid dehydrogenase/isomerase domain-containing protein n=1 Tax=Exophiala aquamarina CBS 119918 TaxID=1182545 RepID=A0A072P630_9EURO|nr:uncharacterized protein A1O9_09175 [Exophiala aquamarina CBS 119918]KEF54733.1 hypothetical protein A1O9_09175 [Exophiala aquamarina CBS 119918]
MAANKDFALPQGSTVLVTGSNGFLGAHIVDQFLKIGYKVRATVRDANKDSWMSDHFDNLYGKGKFKLVAVPQMEVDGAFDEAIKGVDVFMHSAATMLFDNEASLIIPVTIAGALNAIKAAYKEPSVNRFVLTSSSAAAVGILYNDITVVEDSWNERAVQRAWADPPYEEARPLLVYEASKTQAEQAVWEFHKENHRNRPDLVVNTVLPNLIFGRPVSPRNQGYRTSSGMIADLWKGELTPSHYAITRQYFVDVEDAAALHVAAGLLRHIQSQRIFAYGGRFSWDSVLEIMRKLDRNLKNPLPENFSGGSDPNEIEPRPKAEKLLRDLGRPGWTSLAASIAANVEAITDT